MSLKKWLEHKYFPDKPKLATLEDWGKWREEAKKKKVAYYFVERLPVNIRVFKMRCADFKFWFKYRLQKKHKYHIIDTKLKPEYYDIDKRMLYGMFSLLEDFVEIEAAAMWKFMDNTPISNRERGEKWFKYQILHADDQYSFHLREAYDLYLWWKDEYPNRIDPFDLYFDFENFDFYRKRTKEDRERSNKINEMEKSYHEEENQQLIRLINIRHILWS